MLKSTIESILFISNRPLARKELADIIGRKVEDIEKALKELVEEYDRVDRGIKIIQNNRQIQMVTNPANSSMVQKFLKKEISKELTPASLETLSVIAYRGPIEREELEQIRGVNCAIILRNLLIKGLIIESSPVETPEKEDPGKQIYNVSLDFIRHLGINDIKELPDYDRLKREVPLASLVSQEKEDR